MTSDESWFIFNISSRRMWMLSRDHLVPKPRHDIQSKNFMLMMISNPSGFCVVNALQNDTKMNSAYFITNLHILLEQSIFSRGRAPHGKQQVVRLDNCSVHKSRIPTDWLKEHNILRMPHSAYSLYLAFNDFYLFPRVKAKLERIQLADEDQFFECLQEVFKGIDLDKLNTVFQACVHRVQEVSEGNGDYIG
jgi:hypothetical protein